VIVQGRYDACTPAATAWDLHKAWPEADFHLIHDAGHAFTEPGILDRLIEATDGFSQAAPRG
jgi:proline iminopeptidase